MGNKLNSCLQTKTVDTDVDKQDIEIESNIATK